MDAGGTAVLADGAAEQIDCAETLTYLTIGIKDFNKRRKRRAMRVWRGKKYVP